MRHLGRCGQLTVLVSLTVTVSVYELTLRLSMGACGLSVCSEALQISRTIGNGRGGQGRSFGRCVLRRHRLCNSGPVVTAVC